MSIESIKVTESARNRLKELISNKPEALGIRISILSGGCSGFKYKFDYLNEIKEDDLVSKYDDLTVVLDNHTCTLMSGSVLDYVTDDNFGSKFIFDNPNATSKCGCGKSFGV